MASGNRGIHLFLAAVGVVLVLGAPPPASAQKGLKISVADDPSLKEGSPPLVLVEIADFQCPYCGQGVREVLPQVGKKFIHTGKVELIFLDLPLPMQPHAFKAAEAAACADEQGKFWDMYYELFGNQNALAPDQLPERAEAAGLDVTAFQKCLAGKKHDAAIREDMRVAQVLGVTGTPAYVLGRRIQGGDKVEVLDVIGELPPYEELEKRINALLTAK